MSTRSYQYYAGIDEAGYGPLLGPFLSACWVVEVPEFPIDLWDCLNQAVCQAKNDKHKRIVINDSKKVYQSGRIEALERGVLSTWYQVLSDIDQLLWSDLFCQLLLNKTEYEQPWYDFQKTETNQLTIEYDKKMLGIDDNILRQSCSNQKVRLIGNKVICLSETQFNQEVRHFHKKSWLAWNCVSKHLCYLMEHYAKDGIHVVIDQQGGRTHYLDLLRQLFPDAILQEVSSMRYIIRLADQVMEIVFMQQADTLHFPVALASMSAKIHSATDDVFF